MIYAELYWARTLCSACFFWQFGKPKRFNVIIVSLDYKLSLVSAKIKLR